MIVIVLVVILVMQLIPSSGSGGSSNSGGSTANNSNNNGNVPTPNDNTEPERTYEQDEESEQANANTYDSSIICTTSYTDESGQALNNKVTFGIVDGKIAETLVETEGVNADGSINSATKMSSFSDIVDSSSASASGNQFVDENGTLLVSEAELVTQLESALNASGNGTYVCVNG